MATRPNEKALGRLVSARASDGHLVGVGRMIAYCDAPTVQIQTASGGKIYWRADMCEVLEVPADAVDQLAPVVTVCPVCGKLKPVCACDIRGGVVCSVGQ